jgi:hypothetical protein
MTANIDCPSCKGRNTMRCVSSQQEFKMAQLITRCCHVCGANSHTKINLGRKANVRLASKLAARAQKFGAQVRAGELGYAGGMWYPLSAKEKAARREQANFVNRAVADVSSHIVPGDLHVAQAVAAPKPFTPSFTDE